MPGTGIDDDDDDDVGFLSFSSDEDDGREVDAAAAAAAGAGADAFGDDGEWDDLVAFCSDWSICSAGKSSAMGVSGGAWLGDRYATSRDTLSARESAVICT